MSNPTIATPHQTDSSLSRHRWSRGKIALAAGVVVALLLVSGLFAFVTFQPIQVLPRIRLAPGFTLIDQNGGLITSEDRRGAFTLYAFTYGSCDTCESIDGSMREIQERLPEADLRGYPVSLISISVDPENDDPGVLTERAAALGADPDLWRFTTVEDPAALKAVVGGGFHAYYENRDDGSIALDRMLVLVDGNGIIRGEYRYQTLAPDTDRILRHLGVLAEEVVNSRGAASLAYEAAHYFLCYAP